MSEHGPALQVFACGETSFPLSRVFRGGSPARRTFPSAVFLYTHPSGRRVLFDTGYPPTLRGTGAVGALYRRILPARVGPGDTIDRRLAEVGLAPADIDVYECYDPFTIVTLMQLEDSGFCPKGDAGAFVEEQGITFDRGALPTNTHGGLLSHAYVLGIAHVVELVRQLRGEADAQVEGAEVGAYGGFTGPDAVTLVLRRS